MRTFSRGALALLLVAATAGCAGGTGGAGSPSTSSTGASTTAVSSTAAGALTPPSTEAASSAASSSGDGSGGRSHEQAERIRAFSYGKPLASARGKINGVPATLEVLRLSASPATTTLVLRVTADRRTSLGATDLGRRLTKPGLPDLVLVDLAGKKLYRPGSTRGGRGVWGSTMTSEVPEEVGATPVFLHAVYAPLPGAVRSVQVRAGGFPDVTVPVAK